MLHCQNFNNFEMNNAQQLSPSPISQFINFWTEGLGLAVLFLIGKLTPFNPCVCCHLSTVAILTPTLVILTAFH